MKSALNKDELDWPHQLSSSLVILVAGIVLRGRRVLTSNRWGAVLDQCWRRQ